MCEFKGMVSSIGYVRIGLFQQDGCRKINTHMHIRKIPGPSNKGGLVCLGWSDDIPRTGLQQRADYGRGVTAYYTGRRFSEKLLGVSKKLLKKRGFNRFESFHGEQRRSCSGLKEHGSQSRVMDCFQIAFLAG